MELSRRSTITLAGCCLVPLSGCSSSGTDEIRIEYLAVENEHPDPQNVQVLLVEDGEPVYMRTVSADGFDEETNTVGGEILEGYPERSGEYVVYATRAGTDEPVKSDLTELDSECCQIIIKYRPDGSISILRSKDCERPGE